jgi:hypothetical protein
MRRWFVLAALVIAVLVLSAAPGMATVHPIQSGDCNGFNDPLSPSGGDPPGITGQSNTNANNFARPLFATGVIISFPPPVIDFNNPALNGDNGNCPNGSSDF